LLKDSDSDGLSDGDEVNVHGTSPLLTDTDDDGMADGWEVRYDFNPSVVQTDGIHGAGDDLDGDGLTNLQEFRHGANPFDEDTDDDGLEDGDEVNVHGTSPLRPDTDGDGLTDLQEITLKADWPCLDPLAWDSDGDMLPDGWELQYNLSPCECAATNSLAWDADNDGLGLFDEYRYCTDPFNPDTDGDGVRDGDEVPHSPGSCPTDASDNGSSTNCVTLRLTVGDSSGSHSERWNLDIFEEATGRAVYHHCNPNFGTPDSAEYSVVKGKAYTFKLRWVATDPAYTGTPKPDFDWQALVNDSARAGAREGLYATGAFVVEDPDDLLTGEMHGNDVNTTVGKTGRIIVPKVETIEAYCGKFGASGSFGKNPEIFAGGQTDFGQPDQPPPYWWLPGTYANPSSQVLKVFFKYVKNANDEPAPFDIDLKANILPAGMPDSQLNISWNKREGPSGSGSFNKTDGRQVKFQNPTKGGLYKFQMRMGPQPNDIAAGEAWVLLPKAGGEIADWMVSEVSSLVTRAAEWEAAVRAVAVARGLNEDEFLKTAWKAIATCDFDYQGIVGSPTKRYSFRDSDRPAGHTPDPSIPGMAGEKGNGDWDEPSYATLRGIVVHRAKVNNVMYAVWGRKLGYTEFELKAGAFWNAMGRSLWDDSSSRRAVKLGSDLYNAHSGGGNMSAILTKSRAREIQSPDTSSGLNDVNLWPDTTPVSSGFWLPAMPTDYDSLDEGENEMPRGRLF
jgi:hypothetical protein